MNELLWTHSDFAVGDQKRRMPRGEVRIETSASFLNRRPPDFLGYVEALRRRDRLEALMANMTNWSGQ